MTNAVNRAEGLVTEPGSGTLEALVGLGSVQVPEVVRCHVLSSQLGDSHLVVVALADYSGTPADGGVLLVAENGKVSKARGVFAGWAHESPARVALALIELDRLADVRLRADGLNPLARGRYAVSLNAADVQGLLPPVPARWAA